MKHDCSATRTELQIKKVCPRVAAASLGLLRVLTALACICALLSSGTVQAAEETSMRVVAGDGTAGFEDGFAARFRKPIRLAPWGEDAILVADIYNHAIRVVTLEGEVTTLAGSPDWKGHQDGLASEAKFASPHGVAVSPTGVIAVGEAENHTIRLLTPDGEGGSSVSTLADVPGESGMRDGAATEALFASPHSVAWTKDGALLVADMRDHRVLSVDLEGSIQIVGGTGSAGSTPEELNRPAAVLAHGPNLWIADLDNHRITVVPLTGPEGSD